MDTPILLCVYRRLEKVQLLLNRLREVKPRIIYVSGNAPKNKHEKIYCDAIKNEINNIDWECTVYTKYESKHIADPSFSITNGIDWFFSNVPYGIILEDDSIPSPSFFSLCSHLLSKYEEHNEIYHIAGTNTSYDHAAAPRLLYSNFCLPPWGWATWKRCWEKYNPNMDNWRDGEQIVKSKVVDFDFWENMLDSNAATKAGWDLQWNVDIWLNGGKILMPSYNLITNIGFDDLATYTFNKNNVLANLPVKDFPLPVSEELTEANNAQLEAIFIKGLKTLRS